MGLVKLNDNDVSVVVVHIEFHILVLNDNPILGLVADDVPNLLVGGDLRIFVNLREVIVPVLLYARCDDIHLNSVDF